MKRSLTLCFLMLSCQAQTVPQKTEGPTTTATDAAKPPSTKTFDEQLTALIQPVIDDRWATGMLVGVVREGESKVYSFGKISAENPSAPDESTLFEIGSVTKVFTTTMLSEMVQQKTVSLDDPIQNYLPTEVTAAKRMEQPITLRELATHTAGIAAVADNFWPREPGNIYDPNFAGKGWSSYTNDQLYSFIQNPSPGIFPFKRYLYSNMSLGLLGHLLSRKLEKPYEQALIDMVLTPLQMNDTRITLSDEQRRRLAPGHDADLTPTNPWTTSAIDGAFALRSSMHDLMIFAKANMGLIETPLYPAMKAAHEEQFKKSAAESVGLGWNTNVNGVLFHSGATGGYRSAVYLIPKSKLAVIVLTNTIVGGTTDARSALFEVLVANVLQLVAGAPLLPLEFPKVGVSKRDIKEYVGQYGDKLDDPKNLRVLLSTKGELQAIPPGKIANRLYPASEDVFFMKAFDTSVTFIPGGEGKIESVEATIEGVKRTLKRLD